MEWFDRLSIEGIDDRAVLHQNDQSFCCCTWSSTLVRVDVNGLEHSIVPLLAGRGAEQENRTSKKASQLWTCFGNNR
jgi:hypothetical protein